MVLKNPLRRVFFRLQKTETRSPCSKGRFSGVGWSWLTRFPGLILFAYTKPLDRLSAQPGDVLARRGAKQTAVFTAELRRAFVAHFVAD